MNKFAPFAALATLATFALVPLAVHAATPARIEGKMLYSAKGQMIAPVYHANADGSVEVIVDSQLYTVPAATISVVNGKVTTSESKSEVTRGA